MSAWLKTTAENGKELMEWNDTPSPASLRELPRKAARLKEAKASPSKI